MCKQSYCLGGDVGKLKKECGELDQGSVEKNVERVFGFGKGACWMWRVIDSRGV